MNDRDKNSTGHFDGKAILGTPVPLTDLTTSLGKVADGYASHGNNARAEGVRDASKFVAICLTAEGNSKTQDSAR